MIRLIKGENKGEAYNKTIRHIKDSCESEYGSEFIHFKNIFTGELNKLTRGEIKSSGYVVDTLEAAFWSFMTTNNYEEAILTAINLGGDTDTIGALTGGLAGIFYGFERIPDSWLQYLPQKEKLLKQIQRFGAASGLDKTYSGESL